MVSSTRAGEVVAAVVEEVGLLCPFARMGWAFEAESVRAQ